MILEKRQGDARDECGIDATLQLPSGATEIPCVVTDISVDGARLRIDPAAELTTEFKLALPLTSDHQDRRLVELRWRKGPAAGVRFIKPKPRSNGR